MRFTVTLDRWNLWKKVNATLSLIIMIALSMDEKETKRILKEFDIEIKEAKQ